MKKNFKLISILLAVVLSFGVFFGVLAFNDGLNGDFFNFGNGNNGQYEDVGESMYDIILYSTLYSLHECGEDCAEHRSQSALRVFSPDGTIETIEVDMPEFFDIQPAISVPNFTVTPLHQTGSDSERIVITIMGCGFTAGQQNAFLTRAQTLSNHILNMYPFSVFENALNIYAIQVISNVSGVAPRRTQLIDNFFGSTFYFDNVTQRLLYITRTDRAHAVLAAHTPEYNVPLIIANSTVYGGAGGYFAVSSINQDLNHIMIHEMGHSVGDLGDEYWAGAQFAWESPNLTRNNNRNTIRWWPWLGIEGVDIFTFAEALPASQGWFRPHQNCKMRFLNRAFCRVCSTELTRRMALINEEPFHGQSNLTSIIIPAGTTRIVNYVFNGSRNLTSVTIPRSVTSIGQFAFLQCTNLTQVVNWATTPQSINANDVFRGVNRANIRLYVPRGRRQAYINAGWTGFREIVEVDFNVTTTIPEFSWNEQQGGQLNRVHLRESNNLSKSVYVVINRNTASGLTMHSESRIIEINNGSGIYDDISNLANLIDENDFLEILVYEYIGQQNPISRQIVSPAIF